MTAIDTSAPVDVPVLADGMVVWLTHVARTQAAQIADLQAQVRALQVDNAHLEHAARVRSDVDTTVGGGRCA